MSELIQFHPVAKETVITAKGWDQQFYYLSQGYSQGNRWYGPYVTREEAVLKAQAPAGLTDEQKQAALDYRGPE